MFRSLLGQTKDVLLTPCLLLDLDAVERNIEKMARFSAEAGCNLRPHAKTHKSVAIARMQVGAGAIGITCARLQDATAFARAGIENILVANQIVDPTKILELVDVCRTHRITVCVDSYMNARDISERARDQNAHVDVLIEVDIGLKRCGVAPGQDTLDLARSLKQLSGISLRGLMGYEGALFGFNREEKLVECEKRLRSLNETKNLLLQNGIALDIVSSGGSNTYEMTGLHPGVTEIQPGSYVTMDDWNHEHGIDFEQAVTVLATVISRPSSERAVIDAGIKALSTDLGTSRVLSPRGLHVKALNEEHGIISIDPGSCNLQVGDRVELVPRHGCTTIPLHGQFIALRRNRVAAALPLVSTSAAY